MEIIKDIAGVKTDSNDKPLEPVYIATVTTRLKKAQRLLND